MHMKLNEIQFSKLLKGLTDIGKSLSAEKDHNRLLEMILLKALDITNADGGTIYTCMDNNKLKFEIVINKSMNLHLGGTSHNKIPFNDLPVYNEQGQPNVHMLAPWAVLSGKTINIKDAYTNKKFDLSGTKNFDKQTGYRSQSFLTVPLTNHLNDVIGVLQLINVIDDKTKKIIPFSTLNQQFVESLASQAAVTLTNRNLIDAQRQLFDALIQLIAQTIDKKSPYTGGHCRRVPVITRLLAHATCQIDKGPLKDFTMTEEELYELEVAAWLHDCGKITIPESVIDKSTKLEQIIDGIQLVDTRFEVLKRDATIAALQKKLKDQSGEPLDLLHDAELQEHLQQLNNARDLLREYNIGKEYILPEHFETIKKIAKLSWLAPSGTKEPILTDKEINMLGVSRGTLTNEERQIINNHVSVTLKMLKDLPYPKHLKNVPELAGSHHEKMDGSGYPRGLTKNQMSLQARMIAIADIFEALTAADRPYKKSMPISEALTILGQMKLDGHIDPDLFDVFINAKVYQQYAVKYLSQEDVKHIDLNKIPGYEKLK